MQQLRRLLNNSHQMTVLYVESDTAIAKTTTALFNELAITVEVTPTLHHALKNYDTHTFSAILLHIDFEDHHNLLMLKQLPDIPLIAMCASDQVQTLILNSSRAIRHFLFTPVNHHQLLHILNNLSLPYKEDDADDSYEIEPQLIELSHRLQIHSQSRHDIATVDSVTSLPNGIALHEAIHRHDAKEHPFGILLLDIDNYGTLAKWYGKEGCRHIVTITGEHLSRHVPANATLYRYGDSDFIILFDNPILKQCIQTAEQIRSFFRIITVEYETHTIDVTLTMGISFGESERVLLESRLALEEARSSGRIGKYVEYRSDSQLLQEDRTAMDWIRRVRELIESNSIVPYFQPIINNHTGEIEKYECLTRIKEDDGNTLTPQDFLQAARMTGYADTVTKSIIEQSFRTFAQSDYELSINISDADFHDGNLIQFLTHKCNKYGISPKRVILEILESNTTDEDPMSMQQLLQLKRLGFKIAIDDFGVGNSNLNRLISIPFDYIKIDGRFIQNLNDDAKSRKIVDVIVTLAEHLDVKLIAEYVHSQEIYETVCDLGIAYSQGFHLGMPQSHIA